MSIPLLSAVLLFGSGLMITGAGAFFSVKGIVMLIPDPEIYYGLITLAVAFEGAKITGSTFLFHEYGDSRYPAALKLVLGVSVAALVGLSSIATYSHLNASISKSMSQSKSIAAEKERLQQNRDSLRETIRNIESQMSSLPPTTSAATRIRMMGAFSSEKEEAKLRLDEIEESVRAIDARVVEEDKFLFLNSLSDLTGLDRDRLFTVIVVSIVCLIDPLAISLILSGSFIVAGIRRKGEDEEGRLQTIETLQSEEKRLEESLKETTDQLVERVEASVAQNHGNLTPEDVQALIQIEKNEDAIPAKTRRRLVKIRDFLKEPKKSDFSKQDKPTLSE